MIIGITGNSGTGKTTICNEIAKQYKGKTNIIDADEISKELLTPGNEYFKEVLNLFGIEVLNMEKTIDRKKLANIIFNDSKKREQLDKLTFKFVGEETKKRLIENKEILNIIDAPLLIESDLYKLCDIVISIISDKDSKIQRICKRDNIDKKIATLRINSQKEDEFFIKNSDYIIINNDVDIQEKVKEIIDIIKKVK